MTKSRVLAPAYASCLLRAEKAVTRQHECHLCRVGCIVPAWNPQAIATRSVVASHVLCRSFVGAAPLCTITLHTVESTWRRWAPSTMSVLSWVFPSRERHLEMTDSRMCSADGNDRLSAGVTTKMLFSPSCGTFFKYSTFNDPLQKASDYG